MIAKEEATMDPNANDDHGTKPLSKWFDVNDELCFNPCTKAQLVPGTVMKAIDKSIPSDIIFVFENYSFDEEDSTELSSFQDSMTFGSSTQNHTVSRQRQRFGNTNTRTSYYVVTLSKEQSPLNKKSVQTEKEKPVMKELKVEGSANTDGVELIYGSKAYLKSIGMRQRFIPLQRIRTFTRMATSINQAIQLQRSGDGTKSLSSSDEESITGEDQKEKAKQKWKEGMTKKEEDAKDVTELNKKNEEGAKKELKTKKQSEKLVEKQQKAEAKRAKREARKNKGKAKKCAEDEAQDSTHFCSALKNLYGKKNVNEFNVQHGISVQEVWRST